MCVHHPDQKITITVTNYDGYVIKKDFYYSVRYKAEKKLFELRISFGMKLDGRQNSVSFYGHTIDKAKAKAEKYLEDNFGYYPSKPHSVDEYVQKYINDHSTMLSDSTLAQYKSYYKNHINPHLGKIMLSALNRKMIDDYAIILLKKQSLCTAHQSESKKRTLNKKTVINILSFLHKVLESARREKLIDDNPVPAKSELDFRYDYPEAVFMPQHMVNYFCEAIADSPYMYLYLFLLFTGMRLGEALGLRMSDLDDCFLTVRHQLQRLLSPEKIHDKENIVVSDRTIIRKNKPSRIVYVLRQTKGRRARRIYYTPFVKGLLNSIVRHMRSIPMSDLNTEQLLFVQNNGIHYSKVSVENDFNKCMNKYFKEKNKDLTFLTIHSLRHTYLTWLLDTGIENNLASRLAGHSSPAITEKIYHHMSSDAVKLLIQYQTDLQNSLCSKIVCIEDIVSSELQTDRNKQFCLDSDDLLLHNPDK